MMAKGPDTIALLSALYEAVNYYRDAMRPFIIQNLLILSNGDVATMIRQSLSERMARQFDDALVQSSENLEAAIDVNTFARLIRSHWDAVFREPFNNASWERTVNTISVIGGARNEASHPPPEGLEYEYVAARLYDIADILGRIGAADAKHAVVAIKDRIANRPATDSVANDANTAEIMRQATEKQRSADEAIRRAEERESAAAEAVREANAREVVAGRAIHKAEAREAAAAETVREAEVRRSAADEAIRKAAESTTASRTVKPSSIRAEPSSKLAKPTMPPEVLWERWQEVLRHLGMTKGQKYNIPALLRDCRRDNVRMSADGGTLVLPFSNTANLERMLEELANPGIGDAIAQAIEDTFGDRYGFEIMLAGSNGAPAYSYLASAQDGPMEHSAVGFEGHTIQDVDDLPF